MRERDLYIDSPCIGIYNNVLSFQSELSSTGFKQFLAHQSSKAPMTAREQEMADIKAAEGIEAQLYGSSVRRSHTSAFSSGSGTDSNTSAAAGSSTTTNTTAGGSQIGMSWTQEAQDAMSELSKGEKDVVQLGIDTSKEEIILISQGSELSLPENDPSYTFYKHATGFGKSAEIEKKKRELLLVLCQCLNGSFVSFSLHILLSEHKSYSRSNDLFIKLSAYCTSSCTI